MTRCICGHLELTHYTLPGCNGHQCNCPTFELDDGTDGPDDDSCLGIGIYRQGTLCPMDLNDDDDL